MTASVSETVPAVDDFAAQWHVWHRRQEARLADPHGFLAITSINWLSDEPQRFPDAPGEWSTGPDGVIVDLAEGEELVIDGSPVRGRHSFGVVPERGGVNAVWGDAVIEVTDATSGVTTYAANRSLQLPPPAADGTVVLDFNRATNLPCAYTDLATCPLPPAENRLPVAVEAGEKIPYEHA